MAVEAALPSELPRLVEGLRLLNRADPFLEVTLQDKGEYVLGAAGMPPFTLLLLLSLQLTLLCPLPHILFLPPPLPLPLLLLVLLLLLLLLHLLAAASSSSSGCFFSLLFSSFPSASSCCSPVDLCRSEQVEKYIESHSQPRCKQVTISAALCADRALLHSINDTLAIMPVA